MRKSLSSVQNTSSAVCVYDPKHNGGYFGPKPPLFALPSSHSESARKDAEIQTSIPLLNELRNFDHGRNHYDHPEDDIPIRNRHIHDKQEHVKCPEDLPTAESETSPREPMEMQTYDENHEGFMRKRMLLRDILHPDHTSSILKLFFNGIIGTVICILIAFVFFTIKEDLGKKRAHEMQAVMMQMNQCSKDYYDNECQPEIRRPALEEYCLEQEKCMNQDPMQVVQTTKITAVLIAEILNEFVSPLEWKTMAFFFILLFGVIMVFNCSLRPAARRPIEDRSEEYNEVKERLKRIERLNVQHFSDRKKLQ